MKKRFQTWHGVTIPPWKKEKYGSGATTIRFVLTGHVPSKKNNAQSTAVRKKARQWAREQEKTGREPTWADVQHAIGLVYSKVIGNAKYKAFVKKHKPILQAQAAHWISRLGPKGLIFPLKKSTMTLKLYFKSRHRRDSANAQQSVQDILISAGIIEDDSRQCFNPIHTESAEYYEEIIHDIAFISLTFRLIRHIPLV